MRFTPFEYLMYKYFNRPPKWLGTRMSSKEHYDLYHNTDDKAIYVVEKKTLRIFER